MDKLHRDLVVALRVVTDSYAAQVKADYASQGNRNPQDTVPSIMAARKVLAEAAKLAEQEMRDRNLTY